MTMEYGSASGSSDGLKTPRSNHSSYFPASMAWGLYLVDSSLVIRILLMVDDRFTLIDEVSGAK